MNDLQDALDTWDKYHDPDDFDMVVTLAEAARRVANPDIEAATKVLHRARYDDPLNVVARDIVLAALGTEPTPNDPS